MGAADGPTGAAHPTPRPSTGPRPGAPGPATSCWAAGYAPAARLGLRVPARAGPARRAPFGIALALVWPPDVYLTTTRCEQTRPQVASPLGH